MSTKTAAEQLVETGFLFGGLFLSACIIIVLAVTWFTASFQSSGWSNITMGLLVGMVIGVLIGAFLFACGYYAIKTIWQNHKHKLEMDALEHQPREIIREIVKVEPAPALPPPAPPVITRGVRLIYDDKGDFCSWDDVVEFARWIAQGGAWSENFWKGKTLYSGYHIGSTDSWRRFIQLFVKAGIIVGMDAETRKTGKLQVTDLDEMLKILDHAAPAKPTTPPNS